MQSNNARLAERALPAEFGAENQLMNAVVRAHMETCDFIREKVRNQMADAQRQPDYTVCPPTLVSCISAAEFSSFFFCARCCHSTTLTKMLVMIIWDADGQFEGDWRSPYKSLRP